MHIHKDKFKAVATKCFNSNKQVSTKFKYIENKIYIMYIYEWSVYIMNE